MPSKNVAKNKDVLKELEKTISPILVVNNSALKPYVEVFEYSPENIYQQPLGSLVGFFEIKEYSKDSSYVVNFLTSVLKKEYYINPKRQVSESFDAALHKVNLALSELAKHGNVEWLGKLHAAICVIDKNSIHFSVSGNAKIFIYRNTVLTDIGEDLANDAIEPHPLKTFVNVSSGRLEKDDRLMITSEDIFHILSFAELKKNFQRLAGEKFIQFLKTALSNQLEMIATIIIDTAEKTTPLTKKNAPRKKIAQKELNVFSQTAFSDLRKDAIANPEPKEVELKEETESTEYTDKKTGHIYIQGESNESLETGQIQLYWEIFKEKAVQSWYHTRSEVRLRCNIYSKEFSKFIKQQLTAFEERKKQMAKLAEEKRTLREKELKLKQQLAEQIRLEEEQPEKQAEPEKTEQEYLSGQNAEQNINPVKSQIIDLKKNFKNIPENPDEELSVFIRKESDGNKDKKIPESSIEKPNGLNQQFEKSERKLIEVVKENGLKLKEKIVPLWKKTASAAENLKHKEETSKLIPHFSKIKAIFAKFSNKQKLYAALVLFLVFVVPYFIAHWLDKPKQPTITSIQDMTPSATETLSMDKNINLDARSQTVLSRNDLVTTLITNISPVAVTKKSLISLANGQQKEYPLSPDFGSITKASFMKDLSLILLITDQGKVISFSQSTGKFAENKINLDSISATSSFIGTYMTYLYVLDSKNNQIYRFPRADGGFGEKVIWYKDQTPLSNISDMAIDDSIYYIQASKVTKLFKGRKQVLDFETSNTPVSFDKIYTNIDSQYLYVLDKKNSRIVKFDKAGKIVSQTYNESLKNADSISVNETNNTSYTASSLNLISIQLQ